MDMYEMDMSDELLNMDSGDIWDTASLLETSLSEGEGEWSSCPRRCSSVILRDRMITEASLPIKTEHSYCGDAAESRLTGFIKVEDDMESECYPAISMSAATGAVSEPDSPGLRSACEPLIKYSPRSSASPSPERVGLSPAVQRVTAAPSAAPAPPRGTTVSPLPGQVAPRRLVLTQPASLRISPAGRTLLRPQTIVLTSRSGTLQRSGADGGATPRLSLKLEPGLKLESSQTLLLPPTPPSSGESSDGGVSPGPAPGASSAALVVTAGRPPLRRFGGTFISTTPRGSQGTLCLTEEEKRTLQSEGYSIPSRLPLSKSEERSLKKIRRKIKNKISAQESRRKKKEYLDQLERRMDEMAADNDTFRRRCTELEQRNRQLLAGQARLQLQKAQLARQLQLLTRLLGADCPPELRVHSPAEGALKHDPEDRKLETEVVVN